MTLTARTKRYLDADADAGAFFLAIGLFLTATFAAFVAFVVGLMQPVFVMGGSEAFFSTSPLSLCVQTGVVAVCSWVTFWCTRVLCP